MRLLQILTTLLFALAMVPGGAHVLALVNKIKLDRDGYMIARQIYRGWDLLGLILAAALIAGVVLTILSRQQTTPFWLALAGSLLLAATVVIFFTWTYPANIATQNWTQAPENWMALRHQWEYSHAINAVLSFAALCCITGSCLAWRIAPAT